MSPVALESVAKILQIYGGWGMTALLIFVLLWLYKTTSKLLDDRNEKFIVLLKECSSALNNAEKAIDHIREDANEECASLHGKIDALERRLESWSSEMKVFLESNKTLMGRVDSKLSK